MTRANGTARCRASANCRTGSIEPIEARHADLALAILSAFVEARAQRDVEPDQRAGRAGRAMTLYEPICSDNFA